MHAVGDGEERSRRAGAESVRTASKRREDSLPTYLIEISVRKWTKKSDCSLFISVTLSEVDIPLRARVGLT